MGTGDRTYAEAHRLKVAVRPHRNFTIQSRQALVSGNLDGSMQVRLQILASHFDHIERGMARGGAKIFARLPIDVENVPFSVRYNRRRRVRLKKGVRRKFGKI